MSVSRRVLAVAVALLGLVALLPGCRCGSEDGQQLDPSGTRPVSGGLPPLELRDDTAGLLLTWVDEKGDFHVVQKIADVPAAARGQVRVVVSSRVEGTGAQVYVADLSKKNPDGTYPVGTRSRAQWDELGAQKRRARLEALAPPPPSASVGEERPPSEPEAADGVSAIIYGAEWCKPCHDAERYLKQRGVKVVYKDIEENPLAAQEMKEKLQRKGMPSASIPIIDVMGQLLVGFDPRALDRAVEAARNAKTL